ncbi:MAG TPA: ABC transporter permease [Thermoflexales bacterium]|nr:ABC transporter permease [Thermoflexales bacterium]
MAYLESYRNRSAADDLAPPRVRWNARALIRWAITLTALIAVWELVTRLRLIHPLWLPAPSIVAQKFAEMLASGVIVRQTTSTLTAVLLGVLMGGLPGAVLGLAMGASPRLRAIADPIVAAFHALPKIALLPLVIVAFGVGETPRIVISALGAFFPLLINGMAGARNIAPVYFEVSRNYGASRAKTFARVILPGSLPSLITGLRLAANTSLLLTIAAEMVLPRSGLGAVIWRAWETMRIEELYVGLIVAATLGISIAAISGVLLRRFAPWHGQP